MDLRANDLFLPYSAKSDDVRNYISVSLKNLAKTLPLLRRQER